MTEDEALSSIILEHSKAIKLYPPFASAHEGYAVILEELTELQTEVFKNPARRDYTAMRKEAIHVAAMALRFIIDVKPKDNSVEYFESPSGVEE